MSGGGKRGAETAGRAANCGWKRAGRRGEAKPAPVRRIAAESSSAETARRRNMRAST